MADPRAEVRNAADPKQVRRAEKRERAREALFLEALKATLSQVNGRLVFSELIERAGVWRSMFDNSGSRAFYNIGRQDYGHELMALILQADDEAYVVMETEARARKRRADQENDAAHAVHKDPQ